MKRVIATGAALLAGAGLLAGCGSTSKKVNGETVANTAPLKTLTIYSSLALQGAQSATQQSVANAELLALEAQRGQVAGYKIRFIIMDNSTTQTGQWNKATVRQNAETAAKDPSTIAYLGDDASGATTLSLPITNAAGILQVSPESTATALTLGGKGNDSLGRLYPSGKRTFARVIPSDVLQAAAQAEYQSQEGCTHIFLINDGSVYGKGIASGLAKDDIARNVGVAGKMQISPNLTSFASLQSKVAASGADCVFYGGNQNTGTLSMWKTLGGDNTSLKLFGPDTLANASFAADLPQDIGNRTFLTTAGLAASAYSDLGQEFFESYQDRFGGFPDPEAVFGYEAMASVLDAIKVAGKGKATRAAVVRAYFGIRNRTSILGTYSIDGNGDTTLDSYGAYEIQSGALVFNRTLNPGT